MKVTVSGAGHLGNSCHRQEAPERAPEGREVFQVVCGASGSFLALHTCFGTSQGDRQSVTCSWRLAGCPLVAVAPHRGRAMRGRGSSQVLVRSPAARGQAQCWWQDSVTQEDREWSPLWGEACRAGKAGRAEGRPTHVTGRWEPRVVGEEG